MQNNFLNSVYLKNQILVVINEFGGRITKEYFNFRCNVCGDSKKNTRKKRGFILLSKIPYTFKCHNCGVSMSAEKWLKQYFPNNYRNYVRQIMENKKEDTQELEREIQKKYDQERIESDKEKKKLEKEAIKHFLPITNGSELSQKAIEICYKRKIPKEVYKHWYIAEQGHYYKRLIIPFYNDKNKIYYFQARSLENQEPKYLNRLTNRDNAIYNFYYIDKTKPIIVTEGIIDSLFIDNSIAVLGTSFPDNIKAKLKSLKCYYIFDNDEAGRKAAEGMLFMGKPVFLWSKYIADKKVIGVKDINDLYLFQGRNDKYNYEELKEYFSSSIFDKILL